MIGPLIDGLAWAALLAGGFFCLTGAIGVLRLPDFYCRTHAAGMIDSLGAALILLGLMLQAGFSLVAVKLFFILAFLWLSGPAAVHALARAALHSGLRPVNVNGEPLEGKSPSKP